MKDAFGVEKAFNPIKAVKAMRFKPLGKGPGTRLAAGASVPPMPSKPVAPAGNFVHYDPGLLAQKQRATMKASFGKRDSRKDPKPLHPLAVGAATAGGALAGQSAYMGVVPFNNHVMKPYFARKMDEAGPDSKEAKVWRDWNKPQEPRVRGKHSANPKVDPGFRQGEKPDLARPLRRNQMDKENQSNTKRAAWHGSQEFHRKFPRGLPGWRTHRALSWAGKGLPGHATGAALMGGGALAAYKVATHQSKVKKSFFQYVPKTQMTLKTIVRDPGFLVPVGGVTLAGAGGATLAARKYKKRKLK
jgi:hypothetical protein